MVSYFVRYTGAPSDAEAFASYYEQRHAPILRGFGAIRSLVVHRPVPWRDPFHVKRGESFLLAQMMFDTPEELNSALQSEARARAREDFGSFPSFAGEVTHEALAATVIF